MDLKVKGERLLAEIDKLDDPDTKWSYDARDTILDLFREIVSDVYGVQRWHHYHPGDLK